MSISESASVPPPPVRFDSGAAAFHLFSHARQEGWRPLLGLGAIYFAFVLAATALMFWGMWPFLEIAFDPALSGAGEPGAAGQRDLPPGFWPAFGQMILVCLLYTVVYLVFYAAVDAALLRWLFGRGARLRFGAAELRLTLISLLWCVLPVALFAPFWVLLFVAIGAGSVSAAAGWSVGILCALSLIGGFVAWIALGARLAPAAALTVRDGRLRGFAGWDATRGVFWPVLGAFFIVWAIYLGVAVGLQIVVQPLLMVAGGEVFTLGAGIGPEGQADASEILQALLSPAIIAIYVVSTAVSIVVYFLFQAILAGVNAYIAKGPGA